MSFQLSGKHPPIPTAAHAWLQERGQTAFYIVYGHPEHGCSEWCQYSGVDGGWMPSTKPEKQNPGTLRDKVENYEDMEASLAK